MAHPTDATLVGLLTDSLTFAGSFVLAIDARKRLQDLDALRTQMDFAANNPQLRLWDKELAQAIASVRRARWAFV